MPNWKKLIVSGSSANLSNLNVDNTLTATSFVGNGSQLTGITAEIAETATKLDTFTNVTSKTVTHNFNSKNVLVSIYDTSDQVIIPSTITTTTLNTVDVTFNYPTSGRAIVAKGGHIVSGSAELYTHREAISGASQYTINHNLSEEFPVVQVYDTNKKQVIPKDVESTTNNRVVITFNSPLNGTVVVKK